MTFENDLATKIQENQQQVYFLSSNQVVLSLYNEWQLPTNHENMLPNLFIHKFSVTLHGFACLPNTAADMAGHHFYTHIILNEIRGHGESGKTGEIKARISLWL